MLEELTDNEVYFINKTKGIFVDIDSGNYNIKDIEKLSKATPDFENIPIEKLAE